MNLIRSIISVFLVVLVGLSVAGLMWAGQQTAPNMGGARVVLSICAVSAVGALILLWTARPDRTSAS